MSDKKQIDEMAKDMCLDCSKDSPCSLAYVGGMCDSVRKQATALYNAGYRKQIEGEWRRDKNARTCSECGFQYLARAGFFGYCPNCGAKMKGE